MEYLCWTQHSWVSNSEQPSVHLFPVLTSLSSCSPVKENTTGLGQTVTQKATNLGVAAGIIKADVPPKPESEDVSKGHPETPTNREISDAQQAVGNIKPGMSARILSSPTP